MQAWSLFLDARAAVDVVEIKRAEKLLLEALEHDGEFAQAWELLAYIIWASGGVQWDEITTQRKVQEFSRIANDLDPELLFAAVFVEMSTPGFDYQNGGIELMEAALEKEPNNPWLLESLIWQIMENGYIEDTLAWTEHFLEADPLSPYAHAYNIGALYALGRTDEALARLHERRPTDAAVDIFQITMLGILLAEGMDELAVEILAAAVPDNSRFNREWFLELAEGARDPEAGVTFLDARIEELTATLPEDVAFAWQQTLPTLYLAFGHIDRFYELIDDENPQDLHWEHAANFVWQGTVFRRTGFTAHPEYLDVTEALGIHRTWEQRGPPDFCTRQQDRWVCE